MSGTERAGRMTGRIVIRRRRVAVVGLALVLIAAGLFVWDRARSPAPEDIRGSAAWARKHYGRPNAPRFRARYISEIDFLGRPMFVHRAAEPHFLRLESLFEARAPEYAASVATGEVDDWSYINRPVRGGGGKSNHAFGLAIDINSLTNVLGTEGDMPMEVVEQWEREGGEWGGRWTRSDPMHFETHLTPAEIDERYNPDGTPRDWYLEELVGD